MKIINQNTEFKLFLLVILLNLILSNVIIFQTTINNYISSQTNNNETFISTPTRSVRVHAIDNYLGRYIRGESTVSISGTIVTEDGEPVSSAEILVYLNISEDEAIFIGTYLTDNNGVFDISFILPNEVPEGNRTVTLYVKPNLQSNIGGVTAYYWLYVYSRVHVNVVLEKNEAALFEKNVSFFIYAYFDNGTIIERGNMTFLVNISRDAPLYSINVSTRSNGTASSVINFTSPGEYEIEVIFNTSEPENFLGEFVLADEQDIINDSVIGNTISSDLTELSVYLADKITISFEGTENRTLRVFRDGSIINVVGRYLNISGYPDQHSVNFSIVYFGEDFEESSLFVNLTLVSDQNGFFSYSFEINESFYPGNYMILCDDLNDSTVDIYEPLRMIVISNTSLEIEYIYPDPFSDLVASGSSIRISGYVFDAIDGRPIEGALVEGLMINDLTGIKSKLNETFSGVGGYFSLVMELPPEINSETITIMLRASVSDYYLSAEISFSFNIYNYIIMLVSVNNSNYLWVLRDGLAIARNDTFLTNIVFPANLDFYVSITDDFDRSVSVSRIAIMVNGSIIYEFQNVSEIFFSLANIHTKLNVTIILGDLDVEVSLFILGQAPSGNAGGGISPNTLTSIVIIISILAVPLMIIGLTGEIKLMPKKQVIEEKESILGIILNIERASVERKFLELATNIRRLFNQLASDSKIAVSSSMTTREIYNLLLEKNSELAEASDHLEYLLHCYEKIVYGFRNLSEDELSMLKTIAADLYIYLKSLMARREGEND